MGISKEEWAETRKDIKDLLKAVSAMDQCMTDRAPMCKAHEDDINSLKTSRNLLYGAWLALAGYLKIKKDM